MTLLDAPKYDSARARRMRNVKIAVFAAVVLGVFGTWWFWNWPEEHRVNTFLATVESGDQSKAYGVSNYDPDWQQHPERYKALGFDRFQQDWGAGSANGQVHLVVNQVHSASEIWIFIGANGVLPPGWS